MAALRLGLVLLAALALGGCPTAHTDYPSQMCMTNADCYADEQCLNNSICVPKGADLGGTSKKSDMNGADLRMP